MAIATWIVVHYPSPMAWESPDSQKKRSRIIYTPYIINNSILWSSVELGTSSHMDGLSVSVVYSKVGLSRYRRDLVTKTINCKGGNDIGCTHLTETICICQKKGGQFSSVWWWQASLLSFFLFQSLPLIPPLTHTFALFSFLLSLLSLTQALIDVYVYMRVFECESVSRFHLLCRLKNLSPLIPNIVPSRAESLVT